MDRLRTYIRRYPLASGAVALLLVVVIWLLFRGSGGGGGAPATVSPPAAPSPTTVAAPAPPVVAPAAPAPTPLLIAPPAAAQDAGRADPFIPLVKAEPQPVAGPRSVPVPPPAPLPPPLFPVPEAPTPPPPPAPAPGGEPAAPPPPPPPPKLAAGAQVLGILGDGRGVAIIRLGDETYIVTVGELIENKIRVDTIDATNGLVVLTEDGERFELRTGEVERTHVASQPTSRTV